MIILVANIKGGMARTTVSVMLARAFSQTGKRVALVDATASGDSVRYVQRMQEKHNLVMPFEVEEFLNNPFMEGYDPSEGSAELRAHIQSLRESMNDGIAVVDTNSHHEDTLRALDPIADHVVVPYDYSPASFEPTLRTLASFRAPTTVLPHQRFSTIDAEDEERLEQVTKKASQLSGSILRLKQAYAKCTIPDSTSEFDQLASEIFNKNSLTLKEEQLNEVVVPLNTRISYKHKKLLNDVSRNTGKTIRSLIEEAIEEAYL